MNQVTFAKVLPDNYHDYIRNGKGLPCIRFDQEKKALVGNLERVCSDLTPNTVRRTAYASRPPAGSLRDLFYEGLVLGDSGSPMLVHINDQPVLLTVWSTNDGGGGGPSITFYKNEINATMSKLGGGYQLTEIDLSGFLQLP